MARRGEKRGERGKELGRREEELLTAIELGVILVFFRRIQNGATKSCQVAPAQLRTLTGKLCTLSAQLRTLTRVRYRPHSYVRCRPNCLRYRPICVHYHTCVCWPPNCVQYPHILRTLSDPTIAYAIDQNKMKRKKLEKG